MYSVLLPNCFARYDFIQVCATTVAYIWFLICTTLKSCLAHLPAGLRVYPISCLTIALLQY